MPQREWIRPPLWCEVEPFIEAEIGEGHSRAVALYDIAESLFRDHPRKVEFLSSLSPSQYNSMRIIQEWWSGSIEDDEWFAANTDKLKALNILQMFPAVDHFPPLVVQIALGVGPIIPKASVYRLEIFRLFQMEFDPDDGKGQEKEKYHGYLQQQRERSAFYASVQRIIYTFRAKKMEVAFPPSYANNPIRSVETLIRGTIGACVEACPWLGLKKDRKAYPYFLWDVQRKRTVTVNDMTKIPDYICISHTWGRWRDKSKPFISVPNVPWLVPQNTRFRVEKLPESLEVAFPGTYIWIDLFCIPQDRSERALLEIARQAEIFGNATSVVAWLNDIQDWTGLLKTIEWLSLYCIQNCGDTEELLPDIDVGLSTGLVMNDDESDVIYVKTPESWFTSLWTLQEACLRPDMALCSRSFELLTVGNDTVVSLDSLAALLNFVIGVYNQSPFETILNRTRAPERLEVGTVVEYEGMNPPGSLRRRRVLQKMPPNVNGLIELYDALFASGMNKLSTISPPSVLHLGQHRQCTSNRAEAIMSVVGATNWYRSHVDTFKTSPSESELVLGYYPAALLNEAAQKTGAKFYASVSSDLANLTGVVNIEGGVWEPAETSTAIGSLLPFSFGQTTLLAPEHQSLDIEDHPSTATWTVLPDGKVNIQEAGLLSSTNDDHGMPDLPASILVPGIFTTTPGGEINLHEWTRTFRVGPSSHNYAICVYQQSKQILWGLLLKQVGTEKCLVKVGTFYTGAVNVRHVPSQRVDWTIL